MYIDSRVSYTPHLIIAHIRLPAVGLFLSLFLRETPERSLEMDLAAKEGSVRGHNYL